mmetsp:Transcript_36599/g.84394  ORF Transcript_36599/g.84394 Transcript_36599/m.84394 type:complete len:280 (-) Transcript_36599:25-864(-)
MAVLLLFSSVLLLADARDSMRLTKAKLDANVQMKANRSWHLGGFCFGQATDPEDKKVGELWAHVMWEGEVPLNGTGPVYLVSYDARANHWGGIKDRWQEASCDEKLKWATMARKLGQFSRQRQYWFRIHVHQETAVRDWHFALLACGDVEEARLALRLQVRDGALNTFKANSHFDSSSCPSLDEGSFWEDAASEVGFWFLMVGMVCLGGAIAAGVMGLWKFCRLRRFEQFQEASRAAGAAPVVGKPCTLLGRTKDVVRGQAAGDLKSAPKAEKTVDGEV